MLTRIQNSTSTNTPREETTSLSSSSREPERSSPTSSAALHDIQKIYDTPIQYLVLLFLPTLEERTATLEKRHAIYKTHLVFVLSSSLAYSPAKLAYWTSSDPGGGATRPKLSVSSVAVVVEEEAAIAGRVKDAALTAAAVSRPAFAYAIRVSLSKLSRGLGLPHCTLSGTPFTTALPWHAAAAASAVSLVM